MNKLQTVINDLLKAKYEKNVGETMVCQKSFYPSKSKYYFADKEKNFFEPMSQKTLAEFENGDVKELKDKMFALRSSAAMTYNIFGNEEVTVKSDAVMSNGVYKVTFEKKLETIKNSKVPVNIDALLESENELNFFEMKLFEPFYHKTNFAKGIPESYEDSDRYFFTESAYPFNESIAKLRLSNIKKYHACQMFRNALGIYNLIRKNEEYKGKKVQLINCIWSLNETLDNEELQLQYKNLKEDEYKEFSKFMNCMFNAISAFEKQKIDFSIKLITVKDLIDSIQYTNEKREWLERYL